MSRGWKQAATFGLGIVLLLGSSPGCSDAGTSGPAIPPAPSCLTFVADQAPGSGQVAARDGAASTCEIARVEFVASDVTGVFGASFTIDYNAAIARFEGLTTSGTHLSSDGVDVIANGAGPVGQITVSIVRDGNQTSTGIDFNGTQLLGTLLFSPVGIGGPSAITISDEDLLDAAQPPQPIAGVAWTGGTLQGS